MRIPLLDLGQQVASIRAEIYAGISRVVDATAFIGGQEVSAFEQEFAKYCEVPFFIGCANGTDALEMSLRALGVGRGDRVISVSHTFIATIEAIINVGAEPVLVDVDAKTLLMDLGQVERSLKSVERVRAIVAVHLYGNMVAMDELTRMAGQYGCPVVEDTAQAHGARHHGKRAGSLGKLATFSFFPGKNLGAFGDAGGVATSDEGLRKNILAQRDHGRREKYMHDAFGRNSRLDALQAAVLRAKLPYLDTWNAKRREVAERYTELLPAALRPVATTDGCEPVFHQYVVRHARRDVIRAKLHGEGIDAGVHYPIPVHQQPAWIASGLPRLSLPVTEQAATEVLSLPIFPELTDTQIAEIVKVAGGAIG